MNIKIAGIPVFLKSQAFSRTLNPIERCLIKPFIAKRDYASIPKKDIFSVNIKFIDCNGKDCDGYKLPPRILKKIKIFFANSKVNIFLKIYLYFYLIDKKSNKKLARIMKDDFDYNKLLVTDTGFVLFDRRSKDIDIIHAKQGVKYNMCKGDKIIRTVNSKFRQNKLSYNLNIIRLLFRAILTSQKDGIMLHASCLEKDGAGYVFVGPSNSGKSTIIRMLRPERTLSDDMAVIRRINDSYKIFANPWWNKGNGINIKKPQKPAELRAIFLIKKAQKTDIRRLSPKEALLTLVFCDWPFQQVGFIDNKTGIRHFYLFSQKLVEKIPVFALKVKKDSNFRQEFESLMENSCLRH